ncbi:hypothetical protein C8Z91_01265 [Paenibacillus elgii]|uniref:Uncharacterized protein n=1 Tax=Paenibacillus elgii TaxID=189691 RepID=A0A2T6GA74_9BACL|nr:hypothetical protein [Paenibacillus elgii]PUA41047.1 hypothetical protein C8Z91_01265 [Paenibacillus elgii]
MAGMYEHQFYLLSNLQYWHENSQRYMEMALVFLNDGMNEEGLSFAVMAVEDMLRAFYIKFNGSLLYTQASYENLIMNVRLYGKMDLDTELFLYDLLLFASNYDSLGSILPTG